MRIESRRRVLYGTLAGTLMVVLLFGAAHASYGGNCSGGMCALPVDGGKTVKTAPASAVPVINTAALAALNNAHVPVIILDARSGKYDDGRRIPGAKSLNASSPEADVAKLLPDKTALIVTYCAGLTCPASHELAEYLKKAGYLNVIEYSEGIAGWADSGNLVEAATL